MENEYGSRTTAHAEYRFLPEHQRKLRTLLVDDSADYLTAIRAVLDDDGTVDVVGCAGNGIEAISAVADLHPELVIMDVQMPRMNGLTAASLLCRLFPGTKIVLMSGEDSHKLRLASREAGADGFVAKSRFGEELACVLQSLQDDTVRYRQPMKTT